MRFFKPSIHLGRKSATISEKTQVQPPKENPFVRPTEQIEAEPELDNAPILGNKLELNGASTVLGDPSHNPEKEPVPATDEHCLFVEGVAGGVGVSTIAALCSDRVIDTALAPATDGASKVLVTSISVAALTRAEYLRSIDTSGSYRGVILVHHRRAEDVSKQTKNRAKRVARMFPKAFEIRYEPSWADLDTKTTPAPSWKYRRRVKHLVKTLNTWATKPPEQTTAETTTERQEP